MVEKKSLNEKIPLLFIASIAIILGQVENLTNNQYFLIGAFVVVVVYSLVCSPDMDIMLAIVMMSANRILTYQGISIQLILFLVYLFRTFKRVVPLKIAIFSLCLALFSLHYYQYGGISYALQGIKTVITVAAFTRFLTSHELNLAFCEDLLGMATIGVFLSAIVSFVMDPKIVFSAVRVSLSDESNANMLGMFCAFLISCHLMMYLYDRTKKLFIVYILGCASLCLLTSSRTALLQIAVVGVSFILFMGNGSSKSIFKKIGIIMIGVIVLAIAMSNDVIRSRIVILTNRIINPRQGDISNGRFKLWEMYGKALSEDKWLLFFGQGNATLKYIIGQGGRNQVAHNMLIEEIVTFGIIGLLFVFGLYYNSIKQVIYSNLNSVRQTKAVFWTPVIALVVGGFFSHAFTSINVTTQLFLGVVVAVALGKHLPDKEDVYD